MKRFELWAWWHTAVRRHTVSGGPPDPANVFRCDCGSSYTVAIPAGWPT